MHLPPESLDRSAAEYYGQNVSNVLDLGLLERAVGDCVVALRLTGAGVEPGRVADLTRRLDLRTIRLTKRGAREDNRGSFMMSVVLMMMLYTTMLMWGQAVLSGVIEEKGNRVVEVIVFRSQRAAAGRQAGSASARRACASSSSGPCRWRRSACTAARWRPRAAPPCPKSRWLLGSFVVFFLLGYFLYAAMYAAVGASVRNTIREAQPARVPVLMPCGAAGRDVLPAVMQSGRHAVDRPLVDPLLTP